MHEIRVDIEDSVERLDIQLAYVAGQLLWYVVTVLTFRIFLIEVNVAGEESKFGLSVEEVLPFLEEISSYEHLQVKGLMTIAPFVANPEENREVFQKLKKLSVDIAAKNINNVNMSVLSMGMTNDYQVAVEEGATMVRVGTGIFGERDYSIKED